MAMGRRRLLHRRLRRLSPLSRTPWLFKSLKNLASIASQNLFNALNQTNKRALSLSREEQAGSEHSALATALERGKDVKVIGFYSPRCRLCNSLLDLEAKNADWVTFVLADAENEKWIQELLHYDIKCPLLCSVG